MSNYVTAPFALVPSGRSVTIEARSPEEQRATVVRDGHEQVFDIVGILDFVADVVTATRQHAAQQAFWETLAAEITSKSDEFEIIGYAKWWAHARRYARYVLTHLGVKETKESLNDQVIQIFCEEVLNDPEEMNRFSYLAMQGWLTEQEGSKAAALRYLDTLTQPQRAEMQTNLLEHMFCYSKTGYTYERIERERLHLKEQKTKVQGLAKAMESRSFKIKEYADITGMKHGNTRMGEGQPVDRVATGMVLPAPRVSMQNGHTPATQGPSSPVPPMVAVPAQQTQPSPVVAPTPMAPQPGVLPTSPAVQLGLPIPVQAPITPQPNPQPPTQPNPQPVGVAPQVGVLPARPAIGAPDSSTAPGALPQGSAVAALAAMPWPPVAQPKSPPSGAPPWAPNAQKGVSMPTAQSVAGVPMAPPAVGYPSPAVKPSNGAGGDEAFVPGERGLMGSMPRGRGRSTTGPSWLFSLFGVLSFSLV